MPSTLTGVKALETLLKAMPDRVAKKVVVGGLRAGARIIVAKAKANIRANPSIDSGLLLSKVGSAARKGAGPGAAAVHVGVRGGAAIVKRRGKKKPEKAVATRYAHLIEFGKKNAKAEPFLRPALDDGGDEAIRKIGQIMGKGVEREARALASGKTSFLTGKRIR